MIEINEIWKDIEGYEGFYKISNLGRVKSCERVIIATRRHKLTFVKIKERIRVIRKNHKGYLYVMLNKDGKTKVLKIHRLVAQAFIPNPDNLPCVNHKDEDKTNNIVTNLEWCTHLYNNLYGTRLERIGKAIKGRKVSLETRKKISEARKGRILGHYKTHKKIS